MGVYLIAIFLGIALGFFHKGLERAVSRNVWFWGILFVTIGFLVVLLAHPFMPGLRLRWYLDALHNNDVEKFLLGLILGILIYLVLARLRREYSFKISDHGYLVAAVMATLFFAGVLLPDLTDQASRILNIKTPFVEATFASVKTAQEKLVEVKRTKNTREAVNLEHLNYLKYLIFIDELYDIFATDQKRENIDVDVLLRHIASNIPLDPLYLKNWKFIEYYIRPLGNCVDVALSRGESLAVLQHRLAPYAHVLEHISLRALQPSGSPAPGEGRHGHSDSVSLLDFEVLLLLETFEGSMSFMESEVVLREWCKEIKELLNDVDILDGTPFDAEEKELVGLQYFHLAVAQVLRFIGNSDQAIRVLSLTRERFPDSMNAYYGLARMLFDHERETDDIIQNYQNALDIALSKLRVLSKLSDQGVFKALPKKIRDATDNLINRYKNAEIILKFSIADTITTAVTKSEQRAKKLSPMAVGYVRTSFDKAKELRRMVNFPEEIWIDIQRQKHFTELVDEAIREQPNFDKMREIRRALEVLEASLEIRRLDLSSRNGPVSSQINDIRDLLRDVRSDLTQAKALVGE